MSDTRKKFHEIALYSSLFKGQHDMYFCYLKTEKIAHVIAAITMQSGDTLSLESLVETSARIPHTLLFVVAGEAETTLLLADLFSVLSYLRTAILHKLVSKENGAILIEEYEKVVTILSAATPQVSMLSSDDFFVQSLENKVSTPIFSQLADLLPEGRLPVKDIHKRHEEIKDSAVKTTSGQEARGTLILDVVRKNSGVSIKGIASVVRDCSEKTIQRELTSLIQKGLIRKVGERRWSLYFATTAG